jgi:hypothetical protein
MAILMLMAFLAVFGFVALVISIFGYLKDGNRQELLMVKEDLALERRATVQVGLRARKGEAALRSIANGAGAPVLEAQIALDEIESLRNKELTA